MLTLRPAVMAMFVAACPLTVLVTPSFGQTCACPATGSAYLIQADEPPPPLPEYEQPPIPAPGYYWTPGYWAWNNDDYYWVPGAWVEPPQAGLLWTPGYWAFVGGVYAFRPGYWGQQVGYYGGVDYGYGYGGSGYQGGRWDNGHFFYNTTVNNIGGAHITNVYNQPIVRNATVSRASFNGGPGGVVAAPTAAQSVVDKAQHVPPTAAQRNQARLASLDRTQFVSANQGKPAVAATERPGEFKGKGAVPAKAAGKAAEATPTAPAPAGSVLPETKEKPPIGAKPAEPGAPATAPRVGERPPAAEKLVTPEATPNAAKKEEKPPAGKPPASAERAPEKASVVEKPPTERQPAAEKPARPEPNAAAQRAIERPPAQAERRPAQPERKPETKECGRPGLPPCPK
jgi:WXXGXW repeat (2 copies)